MTARRFWYWHNGDEELAASLGLRDWPAPSTDDVFGPYTDDYVDMGTAELRYASDAKPYARVKIEVYALPAQFYRFTVEIIDGEGMGGVLKTGSGGLSDYWPTVLHFAQGMIQWEPAA